MRKKKSITYRKWMAFKLNDLLLINFGEEKPSIYKVVEANKRKNILKIEVVEEHYKGSDGPFKVGDVIDIGKFIFEEYWFFILEKAK